jgi:hypothetical protein
MLSFYSKKKRQIKQNKGIKINHAKNQSDNHVNQNYIARRKIKWIAQTLND